MFEFRCGKPVGGKEAHAVADANQHGQSQTSKHGSDDAANLPLVRNWKGPYNTPGLGTLEFRQPQGSN
jgi:hypothetical protein